MNSTQNQWPAAPYKGLSFYGQSDAPLFAGREEDIRQFARILSQKATRIVILQGATGCGKSSFLRAGLLPFLEFDPSGFQFLKDTDHTDQNYKALFVRSTDCPLIKLAEVIYGFASKSVQVETILGTEHLDLPRVLQDYSTQTSFIEMVGTSAEKMMGVLADLASILPKTLVLVIDQAEEVLTLNLREEGERFRNQYFDFLAAFSNLRIDIKLLVALRTEYYGRYHDRARQSLTNVGSLRDYYLSELTKEQLVRAIERPTKKENVPGYGKPYDHYRFAYEENLPAKMANDLKLTAIAGGALPVMQIVCDNLYRRTKAKAPSGGEWVITRLDYNVLGGVHGQMDDYVSRVLESLCRDNGIPAKDTQAETTSWKEVLSRLVKLQVDDTVTTEIVKENDLQRAAIKANCRIPSRNALTYLSDDQRRILRQVDVLDLRTGLPIPCYSLGHDAIGVVLKKWNVTREEERFFAANQLRTRVTFALATLIVAVAFMVFVWLLVASLGRVTITREKFLSGILPALLAIASPLIAWLLKDRLDVIYPQLLTIYALLLPVGKRRQFLNDKRYRLMLKRNPGMRMTIQRSMGKRHKRKRAKPRSLVDASEPLVPSIIESLMSFFRRLR